MEYKCNLKLAVVCSSNMNRSMEAHACLQKKGYNVYSFGTADKVKLPGPAPDKPNCYEFGTSYEDIYNDLVLKDRAMYTQNGILNMLDRNKRIKSRPEKLQQSDTQFDLIITVEERVYDQTVEFFEADEGEKKERVRDVPVHVINMDVADNHEDATIGAFLLCELVNKIADTQDLDNDMDELLQNFEHKAHRELLHCVLFY